MTAKPFHMMTEAERDAAWDAHHSALLSRPNPPAWLREVIREKESLRAERVLAREREARVRAERRADFEARKKARVVDLARVEQARVTAWWLHYFDASAAFSLEWLDKHVPKAGWPPNHEPEVHFVPDPELDALEAEFAQAEEAPPVEEKESSFVQRARELGAAI